MTYHNRLGLSGGDSSVSSGGKVSVTVASTAPPPSDWKQRVISAAQAYYDALVRARALMPTWTPGDAQINAAKKLLDLAKRPVQTANLVKFRAELLLAFSFSPQDASSAPASRANDVAAATSARAAAVATLGRLKSALLADPTAPVTSVLSTLTMALSPKSSTSTASATPVIPTPTPAPAPTPPASPAPSSTAADQMVECTDGYVRDSYGLCVPGAAPPVSYPTTSVPTMASPSASSGLLGVSYKWWGLGAAGLALVGGVAIMSSRKSMAANRRRKSR